VKDFYHLSVLSKLLQITYDICRNDRSNSNDLEKLQGKSLIEEISHYLNRSDYITVFKGYLIHTGLFTKKIVNSDNFKEIQSLIFFISLLFCYLYTYCKNIKIDISDKYQNIYFEYIRRKNNLLKADATYTWLEINNINNNNSLIDFKRIGALFYFIVELNNTEYLGINTTMDFKSWLLEAYSLSRNKIINNKFYDYFLMILNEIQNSNF